MAKRIRRNQIPPALEGMVRQYIETALWSTSDNTTPSGGYTLDRNYSPEDISARFHNLAVDTCAAFIAAVEAAGLSEAASLQGRIGAELGHDLWLTQNHHGAGFWDGDYDRGDELTDVADTFGEVYLYVYRGRVTC